MFSSIVRSVVAYTGRMRAHLGGKGGEVKGWCDWGKENCETYQASIGLAELTTIWRPQ